jgi:hypothetical protein
LRLPARWWFTLNPGSWGRHGRMGRMSKREPDHNEEAARIVAKSTGGVDELPPGLEAAWQAWSAHIQGCDERTMTLLRAAFHEAGRGR